MAKPIPSGAIAIKNVSANYYQMKDANGYEYDATQGQFSFDIDFSEDYIDPVTEKTIKLALKTRVDTDDYRYYTGGHVDSYFQSGYGIDKNGIVSYYGASSQNVLYEEVFYLVNAETNEPVAASNNVNLALIVAGNKVNFSILD